MMSVSEAIQWLKEPCGDGSCVVGRGAGGMTTNGGCMHMHELRALEPGVMRMALGAVLRERRGLTEQRDEMRTLLREARTKLYEAMVEYVTHDADCAYPRNGTAECNCHAGRFFHVAPKISALLARIDGGGE